MASTFIPEPHFVDTDEDFIALVDELRADRTLDKLATESGLSRHTLRTAFAKGTAGKLSSVLAVCRTLGYRVIVARDRDDMPDNSFKPRGV